jgi:3-hydroxyisobutyrate dehydrogenase-like beta-hydroxyacid dehydrogenase
MRAAWGRFRIRTAPALPVITLKSKAITERRFDPQFKLKLAAKDAQLMEEAVRRHQLSLPLVAAIAQRMAEGAKENPDKDMSASYLTSPGSPRQ